MNQFVLDLANGKFDGPNTDGADGPELNAAARGESFAPENGAEPSEVPARNDDEFGMGPEGEDDVAGNTGDSKADANGSTGLRETMKEVSVMPEGNQVMIRTIPPDIGRVKLEAVSLVMPLSVRCC